MPFDFRGIFESMGAGYQDFISKMGSPSDQQKWQTIYDAVYFSESQLQLIQSFSRPMPILVMAGAWCGDCAKQCPVIQKIADQNARLTVRYVDRDASKELAGELTICGAPRIPQAVMFDEDFNPVSRVGEKTLSQYRELHARLAGASCSIGLLNICEIETVTQEWLDQFEYSQLVLRLSPRLRERYGD